MFSHQLRVINARINPLAGHVVGARAALEDILENYAYFTIYPGRFATDPTAWPIA